jgi:hypothetical protein
MNIPTEEQEQEALFEWVAVQNNPFIKFLFAIPNGGYRPPKTACMLKRTGVKPGVPDMFLPVPHPPYHGLFIELKRVHGGAVSYPQKIWIDTLKSQGYRVEVCKGWVEARDAILDYLEIKTTNTAVNSCVACGADMPEGDQVCINCRKEWKL